MTETELDPRVNDKRVELVTISQRISERKEAQEADFGRRRELFRELIGLGVRKSEIARWAGVTHAAVNDVLSKS